MIENKRINDEEDPQINGMSIDCLADKWGEIVEKSPMVSPQTLHKEANAAKLD